MKCFVGYIRNLYHLRLYLIWCNFLPISMYIFVVCFSFWKTHEMLRYSCLAIYNCNECVSQVSIIRGICESQVNIIIIQWTYTSSNVGKRSFSSDFQKERPTIYIAAMHSCHVNIISIICNTVKVVNRR